MFIWKIPNEIIQGDVKVTVTSTAVRAAVKQAAHGGGVAVRRRQHQRCRAAAVGGVQRRAGVQQQLQRAELA